MRHLFVVITLVLSAASATAQWTQPNGSGDINNTNSGKVGIGRTFPLSLLHVGTATSNSTSTTLTVTGGVLGNRDIDFRGIHVSNDGTEKVYGRIRSSHDGPYTQSGGLQFMTAENDGNNVVTLKERMTITTWGNVGINTDLPMACLDVNGNANFSGTVTGGNIQAKYQDLAEWVPADRKLTPGTVVVLDVSESNRVMPSSRAYDTTVAGVVSAQPGLLLGEGGSGKEMIATTGRVKVRVDAGAGSIAIGDLLVTSDIAGTAMKSQQVDVGGISIHRPGTIIGKALEPLASGKGEILVLLSMQ